MAALKTKHYEWLVGARSKNQILLLRLYNFKRNSKVFERDASRRSLYALLVGAAFSLWRAAFLTDTKRTWPEILKNTRKLLKILLEDNAINYPQDRKTKAWMGGFYLNNAKSRLSEALLKFKKLKLNIPNTKAISQLEKLIDSGIERKNARDSWEILHEALCEVFERFEQTYKKAH